MAKMKKKYYCKTCNKEKSKIGLICKSCYGKKVSKRQLKENNPNWKGGLPKCLDCGKLLSKYNCKRCNSCARIGKLNNQWIDGRKKLWLSIRNCSKSLNWKKTILKNNNYTCQECSQYGGKLEAHHIKAFKIVFTGFLKEYNELSIAVDREQLLRLAFNYKPFWNIKNGKTLCKKCHESYRGLIYA